MSRKPYGDGITLPASVAGEAPLRIPHGTAPSSPADGEIWTTTAGLFARINGVTVGPFGAGGGGITVSDTAPGSPSEGDLWYESDSGGTFIYYDSFWVELGSGPGGGLPAGSSGEVQFNDGGVFGAAANVQIENDNLRLDSIGTGAPATPASGGINLFARPVGGRTMPAFVGSSGLATALQPLIARNSIGFFRAYQGATTVTALGIAIGNVGTATAKGSPANTNIYTSTAGLEYLVTTAATTAIAGFRIGTSAATNQWWRGNAAGLGGFTFVCRFGPATGATVSTGRMFVGYQQSTSAPTDVNPNTLTNMIGVGYAKGTDTNWQVMFNDGSGTATKVDTGIAVPSADRTKLYELALFCPPNASFIRVQFTDLSTGTTFEYEATTDLPVNTAFGGFRGYHSVGGTSSVVGFNLMSAYTETDV